jgi:tRNA(Ile)-lysidine synthase
VSLQDSILFGFTRVGAAVSGGADSVFLLHFLAERGLAAAVLHVNHKLRGAESDRDEQFVRELAASLKLAVFVIEAPVESGNIEQQARAARYAFFKSQIEAGLCDSVATGHTKDDQAETVLGRFLRGAGTAGLAGIRPQTAERIIRPLLEMRRNEIRASLRQRGIDWREDASNSDTTFLRNRLRHEIIPALGVVNPSVTDVLASTATWAQDEEDYWYSELAPLESRLVIRNGEACLLRTGDLIALPAAIQRRLIRLIILRVRGTLRSIDFRHTEAIRCLAHQSEGSGRIQLPDLDIYRSFDWLRMAPPGFDSRLERDFALPALVPGWIDIPERGIHLQVEQRPVKSVTSTDDVYNEEVYARGEVYLLDAAKCAGPLVLRNWRPGDRLHPAGRSGAEKIKTLFQENRIPLWERRNWPVIVRDQSIIWTRRFGAASDFAAGAESCQILSVRECRESNPATATSIQAGASAFPGIGGSKGGFKEVS